MKKITAFVLCMLLYSAPATLAVANSSADCLFDWADQTYPRLFAPTKVASQTSGIYYYRYYASTNSYLGVDKSTQHFVYVGPLQTTAPLLDLGSVSQWLTTAGCTVSPIANAGADQKVVAGAVVTLDGSSSSDAYGNALTYAWTLTSKPAGSSATLASATSPRPNFTADVAGTYVANVIVNDGTVSSGADAVSISVSVPNVAPVANSGVAQIVVAGNAVTLNGSASSDANNDPLTFAWTLTAKPAGSLATLVQPTSAKPSFTADLAGTYVAAVIVNDGQVNSNTATVTITATVAPTTSYDRFKVIGLTPQYLPNNNDLARAYLDIDSDGVPELFSATGLYNFTQTPQTATPARFMFYKRQANGNYIEMPALLPAGTNGCIHPRKAVVADFNGDGRLDVFVACHGWDQAPFPGERNKVVLSQPDGSYRIQDASDDVGFFHGVASADFNGDGKPDVVVTNNFSKPSVQVWLNDGTGHFTPSNGYLPAALNVWANYFTVELLDVDGDGKFDLFAAGHEWENAPTLVAINPGNNDFSGVTPVTLPVVANEGVVLDVVATGAAAARSIWVLRTSGGDGTFYQSATVQRVSWPSLTSVVPLLKRGTNWVPWIIPTVVDGQNVIASDSKTVTTIKLPY